MPAHCYCHSFCRHHSPPRPRPHRLRASHTASPDYTSARAQCKLRLTHIRSFPGQSDNWLRLRARFRRTHTSRCGRRGRGRSADRPPHLPVAQLSRRKQNRSMKGLLDKRNQDSRTTAAPRPRSTLVPQHPPAHTKAQTPHRQTRLAARATWNSRSDRLACWCRASRRRFCRRWPPPRRRARRPALRGTRRRAEMGICR